MSTNQLPLFPLGTVLMPDGPLMLRIFEPRYLDMIGRCMREENGFVVVLIHQGGETGPATFHNVGTLAKVADWHQYDDGVLGITALGQSRVRITQSDRQTDGLNVGTVEFIAPDPAIELPDKYGYLGRLLEQLIEQLGDQYALVDTNFDDAGWVSSRLAEILPLPNDRRQVCLELEQPLARLEVIAKAVRDMTDRDT